MRGLAVLFRKELRDTFGSPLTYVLTALFAMLMGWLFFNYLVARQDLTRQSLEVAVLIPVFGNMNFIFIFLAPLLTMHLLAGERGGGTLELLLRSDLGHARIILAKFFSALVAALFMISFTLVYPAILLFSGYDDWPVILTGYLGLALSVMCYLAVGLFTSSLTENRALAAFGGFFILLGIMLLVITAQATDNMFVARLLHYLSAPAHFAAFTRGSVSSYSLVYFASFTGFFLYLTYLSLDRRNW